MAKIKSLLKLSTHVLPDLFKMAVIYWPGQLGNYLRYYYYRRRLRRIGQGVIIDCGVHIVHPSYITIDDNTHIDRFVTLIAGPPYECGRTTHSKSNQDYRHEIGEIHIGKNVHIAPFAYLLGHGGISVGDNSCITSGARVYSISHHYRNLTDPRDTTFYSFSSKAPFDQQLVIVGSVVLDNNTALGLNSIVLPGSTISENSWIGIMSSVNGTIPPNVIAAGNPAVVIKKRI